MEEARRRKLRFGILGAGYVAQVHAEAISNLVLCSLVAVADVDRNRAEELSNKFNVPSCFDNYHDLLRQDLDAVIVCTPNYLHAKQTIDAAKEGKHVLVEKPMANNPSEAQKIIDTCYQSRVKLGVVFQNRYSKASIHMKNLLAQKTLGKLILGKVSVDWYRTQDYFDSVKWRGGIETAGGGVLMVQGIHYIDLFLWFMGPIDRLIGAEVDTLSIRAGVEDTAIAVMHFVNGAFGVVEATISSYPQFPAVVEILGEEGKARWEDDFFTGRQSVRVWTKQGEEIVDDDGFLNRSTISSDQEKATSPAAYQTSEYHRRVIEDFCEAIWEDREPAIDGDEGRKALCLIDKIYKTSSSGRVHKNAGSG